MNLFKKLLNEAISLGSCLPSIWWPNQAISKTSSQIIQRKHFWMYASK